MKERLGNALEAVVSVLIIPWALVVHHRTFKRMRKDWEKGYRP